MLYRYTCTTGQSLLGSSLGLAASGNHPGNVGNQVDVNLVHGQVVAWGDCAPSTHDDAGERRRR
jgi:hypothetical protein